MGGVYDVKEDEVAEYEASDVEGDCNEMEVDNNILDGGNGWLEKEESYVELYDDSDVEMIIII